MNVCRNNSDMRPHRCFMTGSITVFSTPAWVMSSRVVSSLITPWSRYDLQILQILKMQILRCGLAKKHKRLKTESLENSDNGSDEIGGCVWPRHVHERGHTVRVMYAHLVLQMNHRCHQGNREEGLPGSEGWESSDDESEAPSTRAKTIFSPSVFL